MSSSDIKIRTVPSITNPVPRPSTPGRPGTSSGQKSQSSLLSGSTPSFNIFESEEPAKTVFDDMITEEYLQKVSGAEDLSTVTTIKLHIDTSYQSLLDIGDLLKRLDHLTLDGSKISSVRDLGVGLKYLISLSINDCGLSELDGIGMLTSLKELSAGDNDIEDVTALALHETIESIDLHGNKITDISVADTLSSCPNLHHLVLAGNSIERAPKYTLVVAAMIPQLETLDGESVDRNAKAKVSNGMILEAASAMQLEQEELDDERRMEMALMGDDMCFGSLIGPSEMIGNEQSFGLSTGDNTCSLPDNGSDLTHGSAVVLAGSMASAIRRRRNGSPRASSSHSQENDDHGSTGLSTLATLDAAHRDVNMKTEEFFGEGDITKAVQQSDKGLKARTVTSSPKSSQYHSRKKSPNSMSLDVNTSLSNSNDNPHIPKNLDNPIAAAVISAAHKQNSMSFEDDGDERIGNRSSGVSGTSPAGWASRPLSRHLSRKSNTSRSPSPSTRNNSSAEGRKPPKSPPTWQRNASRPQSTVSSARGSTSHGIAGGIAPSAPFKVTLPNSDIDSSPCPSPSAREHKSASKSREKGHDTEVLPNLSRRQQNRNIGSLWDDSSGAGNSDSDSEDENFRGRQRLVRGVGPPSSGGPRGISNSVVKKDNVLRGLLFSDEPDVSDEKTVKPQPVMKRDAGFSFEYKDEDDEDEEIFSTDRKSRHEFMRSEQKERENNKQKQKQMMTFSQAVEDPPPRTSLQSSHSQRSADDDIQESSINLSETINPSEQNSGERDSSARGKQLSEVATRSLGFDLKGSLAAINQWVDDQDSDEEDDEDDAVPASSKYGDVWTMRNEMKRATTAQKKILSRDKILGMCTGHLDDDNPRTRLTADNLAMNVYGGYSYDHDDDDESDCEENEVMFYDNNVDKTAKDLSKSCSLLTIGGFGDIDNKAQKEKDEKKLMSMSLQVDRQPPQPSPKPKKKRPSAKREKSFTEENADSRGCTPSTSMQQDGPVTVSTPVAKGTLETDVRSSPSNDAKDLENEAKLARSLKKTSNKMKIEVSNEPMGAALDLSDEQLVHMLSQPPKAVPTIKTKSGFQGFFRGMPQDRMRELLRAAYKDMTDLDRDNKVKKRMELLGDVLTN